MNKDNKDIGELFRNAFEHYEAKPDKVVWSNINSQIKPGFLLFGKKVSLKAALFTFSGVLIVVSLVLLTQNLSKGVVNKAIDHTVNKKQLLNQKGNNSINQNAPVAPLQLIAKNKNSKPEKIEIQENTKIESKIASKTEQTSTNLQIAIPSNTNISSIEPSNNQQSEKPKIETISQVSNNSVLENENSISQSQKKFSVCFGEECILQGELGNYTYRWSTGEISRNVKIIAQQSEIYNLTITDRNGKSKIVAFEIEVDNECTTVFLPSAFSPNNDGNNDVFKGEGVGIVKYSLIIVDKAGKIVFETNNINLGWDGKIAGIPANPTFYFYFASYTDAKNQIHTKRGQLTLIR